MSLAQAIAATTRALTTVIDEGVARANLAAVLGAAPTTATAPDRITAGKDETSHLNLFLYQVSFNQGWRDAGLPSRSPRGETNSLPPLALDLHYLLIAYGEADYDAEILLGLGMQALHETPILTRPKIKQVFTLPPGPPPPSDLMKALAAAGLADQIEMIKIWPQQLSYEELSRLWTAFQAKYRPSAAYQASVLLIESQGAVKSTLPVRERLLYILPFEQPIIETVGPPMAPFAAGMTIDLLGQSLRGVNTLVRFNGSIYQNYDATKSRDDHLVVTVPALTAGINTVQVVRQLLIGTPPSQGMRDVAESVVAVFILQPVITKTGANYDVSFTAAALPAPATITVKVAPAVTSDQKATLLLDEVNPAPNTAPRAYSLPVTPLTGPPASTLIFDVTVVGSATYLARVRVDGAESPLDFDPVQGYNLPQVKVT